MTIDVVIVLRQISHVAKILHMGSGSCIGCQSLLDISSESNDDV